MRSLRLPLGVLCGLIFLPLGAQDMPAPTDIQCLGFSPTRNIIYFWSAAEDATHYVLEHSVNGAGDFHEHQRRRVTEFRKDEQPRFDDMGLNPAEHYYYRVMSFRERDGAVSPTSEVVRSPRRFLVPGAAFEIYYNLEGEAPPMSVERGSHPNHVDGSIEDPNEVLDRLGRVLEGIRLEYAIEGFRPPWQADPSGPMPVNVKWICNGGQFPANGIDGMAIAPEFLDYDFVNNEPDIALFDTSFHELFHGVMQAYGGDALGESWVQEGPTDAMVDLSCVLDGDDCHTVDDDYRTSYYALVHEFLGDPGRTLTELSYPACLFWAYLCERYGRERNGQDFIRAFLEKAEELEDSDAIDVIEATLLRLGIPLDFRTVFTHFATANYMKDFQGAGIPLRYTYSDDSSPAYPMVPRDYILHLGLQESSGIQFSSVRRWAARYIEVFPALVTAMVNVRIDVETPEPVNVVRLILRNEDLVFQEAVTVRQYDATHLLKWDERMAIIVVGTDHPADYRFLIQEDRSPSLHIVEPDAERPLCIDCAARPRFLAKVQALELSDLSRIAGLDPGAFSFELHGSPCTVVSAAAVGPEYWFILQAPDLTGLPPNNRLELSVSHAAFPLPGREGAIHYCPVGGRCREDTVLVFDRSSSMEDPTPGKLASAKEAARLYVDSFEALDRFGLVSFSGSASDGRFNMPLQNWTEGSRLTAHGIIDAIPADGSTSIGAGLVRALEELDARGGRFTPWSVVLLSDGFNTVDPDIALYKEIHFTRYNGGNRVPVVHAVAIGSDAHRPDLDDLAVVTGGTFHFIPEPPPPEGGGAQAGPGSLEFHHTIAEVFRVVSEKVAGHQQVYSATGRVFIGQPPVVHRIIADAGSTELVVAVVGDSRMGMELEEVVTKRKYAPFIETGLHTVFRVEPLDGIVHELALVLSACTECPPLVDYLVEASVRSTIDMDLLLPLPPAERLTGTPMPILVTLHGVGAVSRPHVTASIVRQDTGASVADLVLHDDGRHGDGAVFDGLFGNTFHATHIPGDYRVEALATETVARLDPFERREIESFHMRADADPDGDGMPSGWEIRRGLDPSRNDAALDPDLDGFHNVTELQLGTDPLDADTDDDGESDLEAWFGRDPNVAGVTVISPARIRARAGVGFVSLSSNMPRGAVSFDVLRAAGKDAPFELHLDDFVPPEDLSFPDKPLTNGITYRYRFISNGANGEKSGPSNTAEATPAVDPYPPHGRVEIVTGLRTPRFREVTLRLTASDLPGEDHRLPLLGFDPTSRPSGVAEMLIANTSSFAKEPGVTPVYEAFASTKIWVLEPDESGFAIVFVRFRDVAGNVSEIVSDAIQLGDGPSPGGFRRADANADASHDISDAVFTLGYLFLGSPAALACEKSADSNDDGAVNISDPIHLLGHLFSGGPAPPAPYPGCGQDSTPDSLTCSSPPPCE